MKCDMLQKSPAIFALETLNPWFSMKISGVKNEFLVNFRLRNGDKFAPCYLRSMVIAGFCDSLLSILRARPHN